MKSFHEIDELLKEIAFAQSTANANQDPTFDNRQTIDYQPPNASNILTSNLNLQQQLGSTYMALDKLRQEIHKHFGDELSSQMVTIQRQYANLFQRLRKHAADNETIPLKPL